MRRSATARSTSATRWGPGSAGSTIAAGWGYASPLLIGAVLSLAGFVVLAVAFRGSRSAPSEDVRVPEGV